MKTTEDRMWIVETNNGIAYIGRDPKKDPKATAKAVKGEFWNAASKSLGYRVVFKNKAEAQKFMRRTRRSRTVEAARILEVEFYKGEMEVD
jgi:hypothetical protein